MFINRCLDLVRVPRVFIAASFGEHVQANPDSSNLASTGGVSGAIDRRPRDVAAEIAAGFGNVIDQLHLQLRVPGADHVS